MSTVLTAAYVVAFFAFMMGPILYLTYRSVESDTHSPAPKR